MITFLEGELVDKQPTRVVLNVHGVGYEVFVPLSTYDRLPRKGERCRILTHDYLREDVHSLFGFGGEEERKTFGQLLGITGIGPKIALSVLSGLSVREIRAAVTAGDIKRLSSVSGVGKKMAERIVVELRDKLSAGEAMEAAAGSGTETSQDLRLRDTILALVALGYKQPDAQRLAQRAIQAGGPDKGVEELVRRALTS
jgi:Holliday junction DNA helicase RuvA